MTTNIDVEEMLETLRYRQYSPNPMFPVTRGVFIGFGLDTTNGTLTRECINEVAADLGNPAGVYTNLELSARMVMNLISPQQVVNILTTCLLYTHIDFIVVHDDSGGVCPIMQKVDENLQAQESAKERTYH